MKFTSPLGGIQLAGAPETAANSVTLYFYLWLGTTSAYSSYKFVLYTHQLPRGAQTSGKDQP